MPETKNKHILLTFDVEDWFQVENFKEYIPYSTWSSREVRVEKNTFELLDALDDVPIPVKATFFVLGWVAEHSPHLVREIHRRGHEVASHGFMHHLCYKQTLNELRLDLQKSKVLLEDIIGCEVLGYRAPSFSITDETLGVVKEVGYLYDSSFNSYEGHGRYGSLTLPKIEKKNASCYPLSPSFYEIPVSNLTIGRQVIPWGGGGYFRLLPFFTFNLGVNRILNQSRCYTFYMHPWEIDPEQPRVKEAKPLFRFRHYINLKGTKNKLGRLLAAHTDKPFITCQEFIKKQG